MNSLCINKKYDILDYLKIEIEIKDLNLNKTTVDIINNIVSRVGSPDYQKTPVFKKRNKLLKNSMFYNLTNNKYNNKNTKVNYIDKIRSNINKITNTNYDEQLENIKNIIQDISCNDEMLLNIGKTVYELGNNNKFWSKTYAKLFLDLIKEYPIMKDSYSLIVNDYITLFDEINYVDPNDDYNKFCEFNKENEKRKGHSLFLVNMMIVGLINKSFIEEIISSLYDKFMQFISEDGLSFHVEEIIENLIILFKNSYNILNNNRLNSKIINISKLDTQDFPSLNNKTIFKCYDLIDDIDININN